MQEPRSDGDVIWPHNRTYVQSVNMVKCKNTENNAGIKQCRSLQIRNVPDYGVTEKILSNPGCDVRHTQISSQADHIQCPETAQWKDMGNTLSGGDCMAYGTQSNKDVHGAAYFNSNTTRSGNGRMRECQRTENQLTGAADDVCRLRWILQTAKVLTKACTTNSEGGGVDWQGDGSATCGDPNADNDSNLGPHAVITDLKGHFNNEFKLPTRYPVGGLAPALGVNFHANDKTENERQYLTCNKDQWVAEVGSATSKTTFSRAARLVLPPKSEVEAGSNGLLTPLEVDNQFVIGFWLDSYLFFATDENGIQNRTYNGMVDNGYIGGLPFLKLLSQFESGGADAPDYNEFLVTYLNNAKTYLDSKEVVLDDSQYKNIKQGVQVLCKGEYNSVTLGHCRLFFSADLDGICSGIQKSDLAGEDREFARYACACNMSIQQYDTGTPQPGEIVSCDNTCMTNLGAFPFLTKDSLSGLNVKETCTSNVCIISGVDITIIDSTIDGGVNVNNMCGPGCESGGCICYMDSTTVIVINSTVQGGINIGQECGTCYELEGGNYDNVVEVSCGTGERSSSSHLNNITSFSIWASDNKYWLLPTFIALFALAVIVAILTMFIAKRSLSEYEMYYLDEF